MLTMAKDNGIRERWMDEDPEVDGESPEVRAQRQYMADVNVLAKEEIRMGKPNPRVGQREGEDAEMMQADVRARIAELQDESQLAEIKKGFDELPGLHPGIEWADLQVALLKDPDTLRKIMAFNAMGHAMKVVGKEDGEFVFVSCWTDYNQVSSDHRNIVFDRDAAEVWGDRYPDKDKNAVKIVSDMGAELADEKYHNQLRGVTGVNGWAWLKTDEATREAGYARAGRNNGVYSRAADYHSDFGSFRASLRVKKA